MTTEKMYISIQEAHKLTGLSVSALRNGIENERFSAVRAGGGDNGKWLIDRKKLLKRLDDEASGLIKEGEVEQVSYLASLFQKPADDEDITPPSATFTP